MKKLLAISLALILALGMVSIAAAEDVITIGFAQVGHESDWRAANTLDYQNTFTAENGYELLFVDADNDHTAQMEAVRNFIQQEVDYIVICPVQEAGWDVVLQEAQDAGIPVIIADRTVSASTRLPPSIPNGRSLTASPATSPRPAASRSWRATSSPTPTSSTWSCARTITKPTAPSTP